MAEPAALPQRLCMQEITLPSFICAAAFPQAPSVLAKVS